MSACAGSPKVCFTQASSLASRSAGDCFSGFGESPTRGHLDVVEGNFHQLRDEAANAREVVELETIGPDLPLRSREHSAEGAALHARRGEAELLLADANIRHHLQRAARRQKRVTERV